MKLMFLNISMAMASCTRVDGGHGHSVACPESKYVTGLCTSAQKTHCGPNAASSHEYICCDDYEIQPHRHCYNLYGGYGAKLACTDPNDIVIGGCASGRYQDCPSGLAEDLKQWEDENDIQPRASSHIVRCCQSGLVLQRCSWRFGNYGEMVKCQNGDVAHGQCASGANGDCKAESNLKKYTGLYCCGVARG